HHEVSRPGRRPGSRSSACSKRGPQRPPTTPPKRPVSDRGGATRPLVIRQRSIAGQRRYRGDSEAMIAQCSPPRSGPANSAFFRVRGEMRIALRARDRARSPKRIVVPHRLTWHGDVPRGAGSEFESSVDGIALKMSAGSGWDDGGRHFSLSHSKLALWLLALSLAYFLAARIGIATRLPPQGIVTLWPSNAVVLFALLSLGRDKW